MVVVGNLLKGLVESIDVIIECFKNVKFMLEKKYIDIVKIVVKKVEVIEKEVRGLLNIYVIRKFEFVFEIIECLKEVFEYVFKGIYFGEDVEEKINLMRCVFGRKVYLRMKIFMILLIYGEMKF